MREVNLRVITKYVMSFFKRDWQLSDYPIRYRYEGNRAPLGRLHPLKWSARIINWPMILGHGETKQEAHAKLAEAFRLRKESGSKFPRPGTGLAIEFASTAEVSRYRDIAEQFFPAILSMDYANCFISDESSLWDFHTEDSNDHFFARIRQVYGMDVSDITSANLAKIFERISKQ